jgi:uncharacterized RDD family membrane protein YckC/cytoskeletal protein CcmA (bactofilin family)
VGIGHDSTLAAGQRADSVVSIFGSSTVNGEAGDVVSILGNSRITGKAQADAVSIVGTTHVDGKVGGDAVAILGNVELGPQAEVGGEVVSVLGTVYRDPAAIVHGGVKSIAVADFGGFAGLQAWVRHCLLYARPLALARGIGWAWSLALGLLAFYACLALLFPGAVNRCVQTFEAQPGRSLLAALIAMLLSPVLIVLLCVTVIGIAAVPFVTAALVCAGLFGRVVILAWLGGRLIGRHAAGRFSHPAVAVILGGVVVLALYLVPVLGFLVFQLLGVLGFGVVVYTLILALRAHQAAKDVRGSTAGRPTSGTPGAANAGSVGAAAARSAPVSSATAQTSAAASESAAAAGSTAPLAPGSTAPSAAAATSPLAADSAAEAAAAAAAFSSAAGAAAAAEDSPAAAAAGASPTAAAARPRVTASMPRAGFWIRMAALLLDVLLVGFLMSALHHVVHLQLLVLGVYGAVMWKLRGSTVGGIVFDLQVVRLDGRDIDWETAIVRALGCFLSLAVVGLGFIWIAFDAGNQAWHDKIAGTVVVRVPKGVPLV